MTQSDIVRPGQRGQALTDERNRKMAASAHAYVRGSTVRFYEWLEASERPSLPEGPDLWICGDCHVGNLGPVASTKGAFAVQIRDLDQTPSSWPGSSAGVMRGSLMTPPGQPG